jgi:glutamate racemase
MPTSSPIGVFDSGIGGLTVVRALRQEIPNEAIVYLGDTARLPYGTKSARTVEHYALKSAQFLMDQGAKLIVIACNTATAHGLKAVREHFSVPVLGVIEPGAALAVQSSKTQHLGVIATESTVLSGSYQKALHALSPDARVHAVACPLLVPLVEEGLVDHPATRLIAEEYLKPLVAAEIDTLILGCTHYPLLMPLIASIVGPQINLIDSATTVAQAVKETLTQYSLIANERSEDDKFFATDVNARMQRVGSTFLGSPLQNVTLVDLP